MIFFVIILCIQWTSCEIGRYPLGWNPLHAFKSETGLKQLIDVFEQIYPYCKRKSCTDSNLFHNIIYPSLIPLKEFISHAQQPLDPNKFGNTSLPMFPFLSGHSFQYLCDHQVKNRDPSCIGKCRLLKPSAITNRSLVFVETSAEVAYLIKILPKISSYFFLLTHNYNFPNWPFPLLNSPKLLKWFSIHVGIIHKHPKLVVLPLGLPKKVPLVVTSLLTSAAHRTRLDRPYLLHARMRVTATSDNRQRIRLPILNTLVTKFKGISQEEVEKRVPHKEYYLEMANHTFVLSPPGHGADCYRTWESLYLGSIPVTAKALKHSLFDNLPVICVDDLAKLSPDDLVKGKEELNSLKFSWDKLWMPWWITYMITEVISV
eukprot:NODE_3921_length_1261_cov_36.015817_g3440_i0.p1 GENE.NODE_3921_length_1261_cov_36.015817_g3440_i0~~NODE_3921_length_1261_cov_36.015817_g3440_i0.p1  ORF type:complete len:374 (+),score=21.43 NODE_3921_length_1261_cov_36.015817_g3440_i0:63-1184(+)